MVKVLILGKGFIGNKLAKYLQENNVDIFHIAQNEIDYTRHTTLSMLLREYNFSHVVNCCGYTGKPNVDGCENNKEDCWKYNVTVASYIDRLCHCYGRKIIHISSGCIYTGYEKEFTETDVPNFGLFNPNSSFYSKSKHALESVVNTNFSTVFRIRMPFTNLKEDKNYIYKILKYDNLLSMPNSLTSVTDLCSVVQQFIEEHRPGIFNVVNPQPAEAKEIVTLLKKYNHINPNWKFVEYKDLDIIANRSNCILSSDKLKTIGLCLPDTFESLEKCIKEL